MTFFGDWRFLTASGYLTAILCFVLGALVRTANPHSRACRLAFAFNSCVGLWAFFYATMFWAKGVLGMAASQMLSLATVALSPFLTHLVLVEAGVEGKRKTFLRVNYLASAILGVLIFVPGLVIAGAPPKLDFPSYIDGGPFYFLLPFQLFFNFFVSAAHLWTGTRRFKGYKKNQLALFLVALAVGYISGTPGYFLAFDIPIKPVTTPFVALYPLILTYAIMKHRFLDIKKLVKNTLVFALLFSLLLSFVSIALLFAKQTMNVFGIQEALAQAATIGLALLLYGPLKRMLSKLTHRILYQHEDRAGIIFGRLSKDIVHFLDMNSLSREVALRVSEILALDRIGFYFRTSENPQWFDLISSMGSVRKRPIYQLNPLIQYLERTEEFVVNEMTQREVREFFKNKPFALDGLKEIKEYAAVEVARRGGVAAFPVFVKNRLRAVLIIGRKKSDAPSREEEFEILRSFMRHLALAVRNAEYLRDMSQSREALARSERDAAAGALIAGIAHEVKNPLYSMSLRLGTLQKMIVRRRKAPEANEPITDRARKTMRSILESAREADQIIDRLSDLANRKPLTIREGLKPARIANKVVREMSKDNRFKRIDIRIRIKDDLEIAYDADVLYEILFNLIRNADQAISEYGEIILEGEDAGDAAVLTIRDTGSGIPENILGQIFEPFFTTKRESERASGTGMGLFIVKEYMREIGGSIDVTSIPGRGTAFRLSFPKLMSREAA